MLLVYSVASGGYARPYCQGLYVTCSLKPCTPWLPSSLAFVFDYASRTLGVSALTNDSSVPPAAVMGVSGSFGLMIIMDFSQGKYFSFIEINLFVCNGPLTDLLRFLSSRSDEPQRRQQKYTVTTR
jgi:hypothetical protein